jgi:hypothetical protein
MAINLMHKKRILRDSIVPDLEKMITTAVEKKINTTDTNSLSDKNEFAMVNPMRKIETLSKFDWDSLSKKRFDTDSLNTAFTQVLGKQKNDILSSDVRIDIGKKPETKNKSPLIATPIDLDQRD